MSERTWDSLTEEEQQAAIKKHSRFLDPVQARKNWETHERAQEQNRQSAAKVQMGKLIYDWIDEDGFPIPKTVAGITSHQALVVRFRKKFPRARVSPSIPRWYDSIRQKADTEKKNVEATARHKREAAQREKDRVEREKRIAIEKEARIIREAASALKDAKNNHERLSAKVLRYEKSVSVTVGQLARVSARIAEIEAVLPSYVGSSLYFKMKSLLPPAIRREAYRTSKLQQYQGLLKSNQDQLKDTEAFLLSKGFLTTNVRVVIEPNAPGSRMIDLENVSYRRRGKFLYPRALTLDNVNLLNIWVRPAGTGKLRIFSDQPLRKEIDWVLFKGTSSWPSPVLAGDSFVPT